MRFVAHHNDVVVRINRFRLGIVELLYQRENERRITFQFCHQVSAATGYELLGFYVAQHTAKCKSLTDLCVQFFAVCQHNDGRRTFELAPDLL